MHPFICITYYIYIAVVGVMLCKNGKLSIVIYLLFIHTTSVPTVNVVYINLLTFLDGHVWVTCYSF